MNLFFDLDGTLTDSFPGIFRCINHALTELGHDGADETTIRQLIGTPLRIILSSLLQSDDPSVVERGVSAYRTKFAECGLSENALFPGVAVALETLKRDGHALQIVTVKPASVARRVLEHFAIDAYFSAVHGPDLDDPACRKTDLLGAALAGTGGERRHAAMIGDRSDDVLAARAHGVRSVAVGWGYGARDDLVAAGPTYLAETMNELLKWVETTGFQKR
jgi:phosphoglycolate phosphatase